MKVFITTLTAALIMISCNMYKDIPVNDLSKGMTIEETQDVVKKKMVLVSSSEDEAGVKQVYQVQKRIVRGGIARQQRYNLFFIDGMLLKFEKESEQFSF